MIRFWFLATACSLLVFAVACDKTSQPADEPAAAATEEVPAGTEVTADTEEGKVQVKTSGAGTEVKVEGKEGAATVNTNKSGTKVKVNDDETGETVDVATDDEGGVNIKAQGGVRIKKDKSGATRVNVGGLNINVPGQ